MNAVPWFLSLYGRRVHPRKRGGRGRRTGRQGGHLTTQRGWPSGEGAQKRQGNGEMGVTLKEKKVTKGGVFPATSKGEGEKHKKLVRLKKRRNGRSSQKKS